MEGKQMNIGNEEKKTFIRNEQYNLDEEFAQFKNGKMSKEEWTVCVIRCLENYAYSLASRYLNRTTSKEDIIAACNFAIIQKMENQEYDYELTSPYYYFHQDMELAAFQEAHKNSRNILPFYVQKEVATLSGKCVALTGKSLDELLEEGKDSIWIAEVTGYTLTDVERAISHIYHVSSMEEGQEFPDFQTPEAQIVEKYASEERKKMLSKAIEQISPIERYIVSEKIGFNEDFDEAEVQSDAEIIIKLEMIQNSKLTGDKELRARLPKKITKEWLNSTFQSALNKLRQSISGRNFNDFDKFTTKDDTTAPLEEVMEILEKNVSSFANNKTTNFSCF